MKTNKTKLSRLNVGDIFSHNGKLYEVTEVNKWDIKAKTDNPNKKYYYGTVMNEFIYETISKHTTVEI